MDYSCGFVPQIGGSLRRTNQMRRSIASHKNIGDIDWHLRALFAEQLKCFETKMETDSCLMQEMQEFYRRRSQVEKEYSESLNKLYDQLKQKHQNDTSKKSNWFDYSSIKIWETAMESTRKTSQAHMTFSELLSSQMVTRCSDSENDISRRYKKIREIMQKFQSSVLESTMKLANDQKEYIQREHATSESEKTRRRFQEKYLTLKKKTEAKGKQSDGNNKVARARIEFENKDQIYQQEISALTRSRNSYLIQLAAANKAISKYFNSIVHELLDCAEFGFHNSLGRLSLAQGNLERNLAMLHGSLYELFQYNTKEFDLSQDKAHFFQKNDHHFTQPQPFIFIPINNDQETEILADHAVRSSLEAAFNDIQHNVKFQTELIDELSPKLEDIEAVLLAQFDMNDYTMDVFFNRVIQTNGYHTNESLSPALSSGSILNDTPLKGNKRSIGSNSNLSMIINPSPQSPVPASNVHKMSDVLSSTPDINKEAKQSTRRGSNEPLGNTKAIVDYLATRDVNRPIRIENENSYFDVFSKYKTEQHRLDVMNAKLTVIKEALQKARYSPTSIPLGKFKGGIPIPLITPQMLASKMPSKINLESKANSGVSMNGGDASEKLERKVLRVPNVGRPKIFGGSIDEYYKATGEYLPTTVHTCIEIINNFGMHHQGVFRVPGSQLEINDMRAALERGECIHLNTAEGRDINSTAGLLKMYFRELGEKPFSPAAVRDLVTNDKIKFSLNAHENISSFLIISGILKRQLSTPVHVVMRYLFAFLNHLTEYSDDNMMDPYNLAICFGPTLMPIPSDLDPVQYQTSINEIVKNMIIYHEEIFDKTLPGPKYEKFSTNPSPSSHRISAKDLDQYASSAPKNGIDEKNYLRNDSNESTHSLKMTPDKSSLLMHSSLKGSKENFLNESSDEEDFDQDESEKMSLDNLDIVMDIFEAICDFTGNTQREISFKKGDQIGIYGPRSNDWYEGCLVHDDKYGPKGLIPRLYVAPKEVIESGELRKFSTPTEMMMIPKTSTEPLVGAQLNGSVMEASKIQESVVEETPSLVESNTIHLSRQALLKPVKPICLNGDSQPKVEHLFPALKRTDPSGNVRNTKSMIYSDVQKTMKETSLDSTKEDHGTAQPRLRNMDLEMYTLHCGSQLSVVKEQDDSERNPSPSSPDDARIYNQVSLEEQTVVPPHVPPHRNHSTPAAAATTTKMNNPADEADLVQSTPPVSKLSLADRLAIFEKAKQDQPPVAPKPRKF